MASTIGQQLRSAREAKGLSIKDAAHETRIHANFLRMLESDDYSGFASITYAKSFLQLYSRFLNIDVSEALSAFKGGGGLNLQGSNVFTDVQETVEPLQGLTENAMNSRRRRRNRSEKPGGAPIFLGLVLGALLVTIPIFYFWGWNAEKLEDIPGEVSKNAKQTIDAVQKGEVLKSKKTEPSVSRSPIEKVVNTEPKESIPEVAKPPTPEPITVKPPVQNAVVVAQPVRAIPVVVEENDMPEEPENTAPEAPKASLAKKGKGNQAKGTSVASSESSQNPSARNAESNSVSNPVSREPAEEPSEEPEESSTAPIRAMPIIARPILPTETEEPTEEEEDPVEKPEPEDFPEPENE